MARSDDDKKVGGGFTQGALNRYLSTTDGEELEDKLTTALTTIALILSLILAFTFNSDLQASLQVSNNSPDSVWPEDRLKDAVDVYGLMMALLSVTCLMAVTAAMDMLGKVSEIPRKGLKNFVRNVHTRLHLIWLTVWTALIIFLISIVLQISIKYSKWVFITVLVYAVLGLFIVAGPYTFVKGRHMNAVRNDIIMSTEEQTFTGAPSS
jgi:hypothetical protein